METIFHSIEGSRAINTMMTILGPLAHAWKCQPKGCNIANVEKAHFPFAGTAGFKHMKACSKEQKCHNYLYTPKNCRNT